MIEAGVGVTRVRSLTVSKIDEDYFTENGDFNLIRVDFLGAWLGEGSTTVKTESRLFAIEPG